MDTIDGPNNLRGAVNASTNVFIGQVVGESLICSIASGPEHYMVSGRSQVKVERNLKGRLRGTVVVRQETDDTFQYGRDGRMETGRKYLLLTRYSERQDLHIMVAYDLGYVRIDSPDERAELTGEVKRYLAAPYTPTPTESDPGVRATWDALSTRNVANFANYPTPFPCEPWLIATATAAGDELKRHNSALGPVFSPSWEFPTRTAASPTP
jgi:hypothetical protein